MAPTKKSSKKPNLQAECMSTCNQMHTVKSQSKGTKMQSSTAHEAKVSKAPVVKRQVQHNSSATTKHTDMHIDEVINTVASGTDPVSERIEDDIATVTPVPDETTRASVVHDGSDNVPAEPTVNVTSFPQITITDLTSALGSIFV